jgi:hypothetical protein
MLTPKNNRRRPEIQSFSRAGDALEIETEKRFFATLSDKFMASSLERRRHRRPRAGARGGRNELCWCNRFSSGQGMSDWDLQKKFHWPKVVGWVLLALHGVNENQMQFNDRSFPPRFGVAV